MGSHSVMMVKIMSMFTIISLLSDKAFGAKQTYIVYMGAHSHGRDATVEDFDRVEDAHHNLLTDFLRSHDEAKEARIYSYTKHINGFAAKLEENQAAEIEKHPQVISVFPDEGKNLLTTHTFNFMMMENENGSTIPGSLWEKTNCGEDIIIANFDNGVWPESKSFSDEGYGPIPQKWKGSCDNGGIPCNRKLIGAKFYTKAYIEAGGQIEESMQNARDYTSHGTHTLSIAAGNFVQGVNINNLLKGVIKGGAPRARVAAYKVCWPTAVKDRNCLDGDILAGIDAAVHDGVDVLSISLGLKPLAYLSDVISIGAFHAVQQGMVVVAGAGNNGSTPTTVTNVAPWIITVGASTIDREAQSYVELGNGQKFKGQSLSIPFPEKRLYPLITSLQAKLPNATDLNATLCKPNTLDPTKVNGKIVVCKKGDYSRMGKGVNVAVAGAAGMILANSQRSGFSLVSEPHILPATQITYKDSLYVYDYINSTKDPRGYITPPKVEFHTKPAPLMAEFSSRGPNSITPQILKPDIIAPGVNILASVGEGISETEKPFERFEPYGIHTGTSMSCPVVAGIVALLRKQYPNWSPAAIKSAIMTTASIIDNTGEPMKEESLATTNPFGYGAGQVEPHRAMDPGLVYDLSITDYLNFLCAVGYNQTSVESLFGYPHKCPEPNKFEETLLNFNYPSITVVKISSPVTVTRKLKNVGSPGTYAAFVSEPEGVSISIEPKELKFSNDGEEQIFKLTLTPREGVCLTKDNYVFGQLRWSDGKHNVTSPIVVKLVAHAS